MDNLFQLKSDELVTKTKLLVAKETEVTTQILHYLREIERRKTFLELGYSSLFEFVVTELKYSAPAASRRIAAMRVFKDIPEVEVALKEQTLSLSTVHQVHTFIRADEKETGNKYSITQKKEVLEKVKSLSTRECERVLAALSPELARKEKTRVLNETHVEIRFTAKNSLIEKLNRIKELTAHKNFDANYAEFIEQMADTILKQVDPDLKKKSAIKLKTSANTFPASEQKPTTSATLSRFIPAHIKQAVWHRDHGRCTYINPKTKRTCNSQWALEYDHRIPFSHNGPTTIDNLQLLCRAHNAWKANLIQNGT